jgi:rod shape-determining protein MreC
MPEFWRRARTPLVFVALAIFATVMMISDRGALREGGRELSWFDGLVLDITAPVQRVLSAPVESVGGVWQSYVELLGVREDNERLIARVAELEEENLQYREALVTSGLLEHIAQMREDFESPMLPSQVVGLDVSPWFRAVLIDRGERHGIRAGQPVITQDGVVGLVTAASNSAAKTMLLLDRQSAVDGVVQRTRVRGTVRGRGTDRLAFEFKVREADVRRGDVIISSGLDGVYPSGLRIGEVEEVQDAGGRLLQTAIVKPGVDFARLEQVFVMLRRTPSMELLYRADAPVEDPNAVVETAAGGSPGSPGSSGSPGSTGSTP